MLKKIIIISAVLLVSTSANASVTCYHNDFLDTTTCSGYDSDGNSVNTTSYHNDFLDTTTTSGYVGDTDINTTSYHNDFLDSTSYILGFDSDITIKKHNFRQFDALPAAQSGTLSEELDKLFG